MMLLWLVILLLAAPAFGQYREEIGDILNTSPVSEPQTRDCRALTRDMTNSSLRCSTAGELSGTYFTLTLSQGETTVVTAGNTSPDATALITVGSVVDCGCGLPKASGSPTCSNRAQWLDGHWETLTVSAGTATIEHQWATGDATETVPCRVL